MYFKVCMLELQSKPTYFRGVSFFLIWSHCAEAFKVSVEHLTYFVVNVVSYHEIGKF
jgi:hypothetical protein